MHVCLDVLFVLSVYLTLKFVISSVIVGTCKSVCKTLLGICHGAFTIARRTSFCYHSNISMIELLVVPQKGIPHVQIKCRWGVETTECSCSHSQSSECVRSLYCVGTQH
jgi:hypothetical protein